MTTSEEGADPLRPVLVGTAGHIDHGKTRLVAALSGVDTDRLPEERRRGISIDLGFAHFDHNGVRFGIIDVPGHERFVRQMVAGSTCLDAALLVVAADDGVMPQTREHFDILRLLDLQRGVIAITKSDLVEAEMLELVADEVRELVRGSFLSDAPVVPVSSVTGAGLDELRQQLTRIVAQPAESPRGLRFRMPVDRVFSLPGLGTVVTGSILEGSVQPGDELEVLPEGRGVRVRSVQHHGAAVAAAGAHRRAAINLPGVDVAEIHRGDELVTPGSMQATRRFLAEVTCLASHATGLRHRALMTVHAGTSAARTRLRLPDDLIPAGETRYAEIRCRDPIVLQWGQRFILRSSGGHTVGGGRVIDPLAGETRLRNRVLRCRGAASNDAGERVDSVLAIQPALDAAEAPQRLGISPEELAELLAGDRLRDRICRDPDSGLFVHRRWLERLARAVMRVITAELEQRQPARMLPEAMVGNLCRGFRGREFVPLAVEQLVADGELVRRDNRIGPAAMQVAMTRRQQRWFDELIRAITEGGRTPPTHKELLAGTDIPTSAELESLIALAREDGLLVGVAPALTYSPDGLRSIQADLQQLFREESAATLAQLRDALTMTRKHVVPLAEFFDARGITVRDNDLRRPGPQLEADLFASEGA